MKLILKLTMGLLCLVSLSGCSNQTQSKPAKPKITTVKVTNQPVSLKKPKQVKPPTRPLPLIFWQKQIHAKKAIYTNSNNILKNNS